MSNEEWEIVFAEKLVEVFGKNVFSKEDFTKKFYEDLKIKCSEFFKTQDGAFDQDFFWSDGLQNWLMEDKSDLTFGSNDRLDILKKELKSLMRTGIGISFIRQVILQNLFQLRRQNSWSVFNGMIPIMTVMM